MTVYLLTEWYSKELMAYGKKQLKKGWISSCGVSSYSVIGIFTSEDKADMAIKTCREVYTKDENEDIGRTHVVEPLTINRFVTDDATDFYDVNDFALSQTYNDDIKYLNSDVLEEIEMLKKFKS